MLLSLAINLLSLSPVKYLSPVPLSTAINLLPVSTTPATTENPRQGLIAGVVDTGEQLIAGVVDTGDKHSFENIFVNFRKKFETALREYSLGQGTLIHEKNLKSKISCQTPFNLHAIWVFFLM